MLFKLFFQRDNKNIKNIYIYIRDIYLNNNIELLRYRRVDGFDLLHRPSIRIDLEEIPVIRRISAEEGIVNRCVYTVHVDRLYFLGRDIEYAR